MLHRLSSFLAIALPISTTPLYEADVRVTDSKGSAIEVRDVVVDYTVSPGAGLYPVDQERDGVRAHQGEGVVIIKWEQIARIVVKPIKPRLEADVTLKNKKVVSVNLLTTENGGPFLGGTTDLGRFSIALERISTVAVLRPRAKR